MKLVPEKTGRWVAVTEKIEKVPSCSNQKIGAHKKIAQLPRGAIER